MYLEVSGHGNACSQCHTALGRLRGVWCASGWSWPAECRVTLKEEREGCAEEEIT